MEGVNALVYDMLQVGLRLNDFIEGAVLAEEIGALIQYHKPDSAIAQFLYGFKNTWTVSDYLTAALIDRVSLCVTAISGTRIPDFPRPGDKPEPEDDIEEGVIISDDRVAGETGNASEFAEELQSMIL